MNYSSYHDRKAGDRVVDQAGKSGIVTEIQKRNTSGEAIAVRWDDGSIALNYAAPRHLRLLANGRLSTSPAHRREMFLRISGKANQLINSLRFIRPNPTSPLESRSRLDGSGVEVIW